MQVFGMEFFESALEEEFGLLEENTQLVFNQIDRIKEQCEAEVEQIKTQNEEVVKNLRTQIELARRNQADLRDQVNIRVEALKQIDLNQMHQLYINKEEECNIYIYIYIYIYSVEEISSRENRIIQGII